MAIQTPKFEVLKKFADDKQLKICLFTKQHTNFDHNLEKLFPGLTPYYEMDNEPSPLFANMVQLSIKAGEFGKKLPEKDIVYYIQTVKSSDFAFADTHNVESKHGNYLKDVILCEDVKYVQMLKNYMEAKLSPSLKSRIFVWSEHHGQYILDQRKMLDKDPNDLIGLDDKFQQIDQDIATCIKFRERLERFGESTGRNYMIYGPPGTGKSSFVRALAMKYNIPIYNVKLTEAGSESSITAMLIPAEHDRSEQFVDDDNPYKMFKIVLLEDFDRYLNLNMGSMSAILNALDGILPSFGVLRFFSANNPDAISHNKALQSRMHRTFFFGLPTVNQIIRQVKNVYDHVESNDYMIKQFAAFAYENKLSMRQIIHYICQFLDSENHFQGMVHNMHKLVEEMNHFITFNEDNERNKDEDDNYPELNKPKPDENPINVELRVAQPFRTRGKRLRGRGRGFVSRSAPGNDW